jgi:DNA repair exonuclease SbcCD nuclease subunit
MRLLHTADLHLGRAFAGLGTKGEQLRRAQMETLGRIVDLAASEACDCVVVAGDLFDSNEVSGRLLRQTISLFNRLDVDTFVLPGTHDCLNDLSVFIRPEFKDAGNIRVFGVHGSSFEIGTWRIHGRPLDGGCGTRPLKGLEPDLEAEGNVAVVHASIQIPGKSSADDAVISQQEISKSGMAYICLGHWHKAGDYSGGQVGAWYPGSPEVLKYGEADGPGSVLLVTLDCGKITVEPRQVGRYSWIEKAIDVSVFGPDDALESEIRTAAGKDTLLRVRLTGLLQKGARIDVEELMETLEEDFFHLEITADRLGHRPENLVGLFPKGSLGAIYVQNIENQIKKAKGQDKERLQEALFRGAAVLAGDREVVR